jgi:Na+/H+ antiporter NhaD/arsenite permease-like protein
LLVGSPRSASIPLRQFSSSGQFRGFSAIVYRLVAHDFPVSRYFVAFVLCPLVGTNIGATILFVEILRSPSFTQAPHVVADPLILRGAIYSLALSSNLGAFSWTISASLAGLLWTTILRQKGIKVSQKSFAAFNLPVLLILQTVASAVVLLECYYFGDLA